MVRNFYGFDIYEYSKWKPDNGARFFLGNNKSLFKPSTWFKNKYVEKYDGDSPVEFDNVDELIMWIELETGITIKESDINFLKQNYND